MNNVTLIGRLASDPRISNGETPVTRFTIAINRPVKQGAEKKADFPQIVTFGKQAENCAKYLEKGRLVGVQGRIQTGSYTSKAGTIVYTTDVIAERVEFLEWGEKKKTEEPEAPEGFMAVDGEDLPF